MSNDRFSKYVDNYYEAIAQAATPEEGKRMLTYAIKEVERDTRHEAARLSNLLRNDILNMNYKP